MEINLLMPSAIYTGESLLIFSENDNYVDI